MIATTPNYICEKDTKRAVSRCPLERGPAGDIEQAVIEQLSAVFRTPTLVAKTYFAARDIESAEKDRLDRQKSLIEEELARTRQQALELMKTGNDPPKIRRDHDSACAASRNRRAGNTGKLSRLFGSCRQGQFR